MNTRPTTEGVQLCFDEESGVVRSFHQRLSEHGLELKKGETKTLQINLGRLCNQACAHCHLEAGPKRMELMDEDTINAVENFAKRARLQTIDITGGAPELHPGLSGLIERLSSCSKRISVRSNLSILKDRPSGLLHLFLKYRVAIVASLPSLNRLETDSQRGEGIFQKSISALKKLNTAGYGEEGTGLELNLISNPTGPYLPAAESQVEEAFRSLLQKQWGIVFNNLFMFGLTPLGRFRRQLLRSGGFEAYMEMLASNFNPQNVEGLMCRSLLSVDWNGYLYDCDFNLAAGLPMGGRKTHIADMAGPPEPGSDIITSDHCYACAAGTGFT